MPTADVDLLGEYDNAGSSTDDLRTLFLSAIRRHVPQTLEALAQVPRFDREALAAWATRWHLNAPWALDVAHRTLELWARWPAIARHQVWADVILKGEQTHDIDAPEWHPTVETESDFRAHVEQYVADVKTWANIQGLTLVSPKRKIARDVAALAQYQVKGDDLDAVADDHGFNGKDPVEAARKALSNLATRIGLPLRK